MSAQPFESSGDEPLFAMPPVSEAALRAAVKRLDLAASALFEQEFRAAWEEAAQTDSTVPLHTFLHRWAVWVALHRFPARSARLRKLEAAVGRAASLDEVRASGAAMKRLLDDAAAEVSRQ